jgi:hypothetical protein
MHLVQLEFDPSAVQNDAARTENVSNVSFCSSDIHCPGLRHEDFSYYLYWRVGLDVGPPVPNLNWDSLNLVQDYILFGPTVTTILPGTFVPASADPGIGFQTSEGLRSM